MDSVKIFLIFEIVFFACLTQANCKTFYIPKYCLAEYTRGSLSKPCGYCYVCRKQMDENHTSSNTCLPTTKELPITPEVWPFKVASFARPHSKFCLVRTHCFNKCKCENARSTGGPKSNPVCMELIASCKCGCADNRYGQQCEYSIPEGVTKNSFADIQGILYVPYVYSTDFHTTLIYFYNTGENLNVKINSGRELLSYNSESCKQEFTENFKEYCQRLYKESGVNSIQDICSNTAPTYMANKQNPICRIVVHVAFPRSEILPWNKQDYVLDYNEEEQFSNKSIVAKHKSITVTIENDIHDLTESKVILTHQINFLVMYAGKTIQENCQIFLTVRGFKNTMFNMPIFPRKKSLILSSSVVLDNSPQCKGLENPTLNWFVWRLSKNHDEKYDDPLIDKFETNDLVLEPFSLDYGVYKVKHNIAYKNAIKGGLHRGTAYCYFKIVQLKVQPLIVGGSLRHIFYKSKLEFTTTELAEPNYPWSNQPTLVYAWSCNDTSQYVCKNKIKTTNPTLVLNGPFNKSVSLIFTMEVVTPLPPTVYSNQIIIFTEQPIPNLLIECLRNCGGEGFESDSREIFYFRVRHSIHSVGHINDDYKWSYMNGLSSGAADSSFTDVADIKQHEETPKWILIVNENTFHSDHLITFKVTGGGSFSGEAQITVKTFELLDELECEVNPKKGEAGKTKFYIKCEQSKDEQNPLTFIFYDKLNKDKPDEGRMLGSSQTGTMHDVVLTRGVVAAFAMNMYGHHQETYVTVDLTQPDVTRTFLDTTMKTLDKQNGGYEQKLSFISAISDVLNQNLDLKQEVVESFLNVISKEQVTDLARMELVLLTTQQVICVKDQCATPKLSHLGFQSLGKILTRVARGFFNELTSHGAHAYLTSSKINFLYQRLIECIGALLTIRDQNIADKRHHTIDFAIYDIYKTTSLDAIKLLDAVNEGLVSRNLPYIQHYSVKTKYIETWMKEDTPQFFTKGTQEGSDVKSFVKISQSLSKLLKTEHDTIALQAMVFDQDPFWWSQTDEVTTAVVSLSLSSTSHRNTENYVTVNKQFANQASASIGVSSTSGVHNFPIKNFDKPIDIYLQTKINYKLLTNGMVIQPDPTADIDIKDMSIVVYKVYPPKGSIIKIKFINLNDQDSLRTYVSVNERPDFDQCSQGFNVSKSSSEFQLNSPISTSEDIVYIGLLPGPNLSVGESMNYTFELQSIRCQVWHSSLWTTTGCRLGLNTTDEVLHCQCYHLSYVAGFLGVPINIVDPFSDYKLFLTLPENPYVFALILVILLLFLLFLLWAVVEDKRKRQQMGIIVLEDNISTDRFGYLVTVFTGCELFSGTTANITIVIHGSDALSRPHVLRSSKRKTLQRDNDDWFLLFAPKYLGNLQFIQIWTDHSGLKPNWFCDKFYVTDLTTKEDYMFIVKKWFGITQFGTNTQLVLAHVKVTNKDLTHFVVHFVTNCIYGFRERHAWLSIFARHPRSLMPSSQRLSLSVVTLLTIILASLLFYNATMGDEEDYSYDVTFREVQIAFYSLCISLFFTYPLYFAFSKTKIYREVDDSTDNSERRYRGWEFRGSRMKVDNADALHRANKSKMNVDYLFKRALLKYRKESFLPVQLAANTDPLLKRYIVQNKYKTMLAWILCALIILVLSYFIVLIGLKIGKVKSQLWLTSVGLSLSQDAFIVDPIKVMIIAIVFGLMQTQICDLYGYDPNVYEMRQDTKLKRRYVRDNYVFSMRLLPPYKPISAKRLKNVQRQQVKIKTWWNFIDIADILFSVISLFFIISINISEYNTVTLFRNMISCKIQSHENNGNVFTNMSSKMQFIQSIVLPTIYHTRWYNGESLTSGNEQFVETGWTRDATHRLMGVPRLRQARVVKQECDVARVLRNSTLDCTITLRKDIEDAGDYGSLWGPPAWDDLVFKKSPWIYNSPEESGSVDVYAGSGTLYHGGGYIAELERTQRESSNTILNLVDSGWLDARTRCVFFELSIYNVNSHILTSVTVLTEHLKSSLSITTSIIWSVSMDNQRYVFWEVVYLLYTVLAIIKLFIVFNTVGSRKFFNSFWTVYDLCTVVFGLTCFIIFRTLLSVAHDYVEDLQRRGKDEFFKFHSLTYYLQVSKTLLGFLFILTSVRVLRLLKYNNITTFKKLKLTLYFSWNKLIWISLTLFLSFYILQQMGAFLLNIFGEFNILMHRMSYKYLQQTFTASEFKWSLFLLCIVPYSATLFYTIIILKSYADAGRRLAHM